jgi:putative Ca2+/H+ antiporter (TMEM165/GDT1 family)
MRAAALGLLFLGFAAAIYGVMTDPERAWPSLLVDGFYVTTIGVSAMFFLAAQRATGARWSAGLRRIPEAFMPILPIAAVLMMALFLGRHTLYSWSRPGAMAGETIAGRARYLQMPWVGARLFIIFALWMLFAWLFRRTSLQQDRHPELALTLHYKLTRLAVMFVPVFAFTLTAGAFDWLISADPRWFSTMYAVYVFAGTFVQGIAAVTLAVVILKERGRLRDQASEHQLHDLGKMLFAFSTFWAYIWVCQYLLIWYGNIPEEVTHYVARTNGPWLYLFALNLVANWVVPFLVLLPVSTKRSTKVLKRIAVLLLCGHWLDLYLLVTPAVWRAPRFGLLEIAIAAGYLSLVFLVFVRNLSSAPLEPIHDPVLAYEHSHGHGQLHPVKTKQWGAAQ